jgi:hypothetical protein
MEAAMAKKVKKIKAKRANASKRRVKAKKAAPRTKRATSRKKVVKRTTAQAPVHVDAPVARRETPGR